MFILSVPVPLCLVCVFRSKDQAARRCQQDVMSCLSQLCCHSDGQSAWKLRCIDPAVSPAAAVIMAGGGGGVSGGEVGEGEGAKRVKCF